MVSHLIFSFLLFGWRARCVPWWYIDTDRFTILMNFTPFTTFHDLFTTLTIHDALHCILYYLFISYSRSLIDLVHTLYHSTCIFLFYIFEGLVGINYCLAGMGGVGKIAQWKFGRDGRATFQQLTMTWMQAAQTRIQLTHGPYSRSKSHICKLKKTIISPCGVTFESSL